MFLHFHTQLTGCIPILPPRRQSEKLRQQEHGGKVVGALEGIVQPGFWENHI